MNTQSGEPIVFYHNPMSRGFSAADVYIGSEIGWGMMTKALEPRPAFQAYMGRLSQRPAFQRINAQNEKFTKEMQN